MQNSPIPLARPGSDGAPGLVEGPSGVVTVWASIDGTLPMVEC